MDEGPEEVVCTRHLRRCIADHLPKPPLDNQPHTMRAVLSGQYAVKRRRRSTSLQVSEHNHPRFAMATY